MTDTASTYLATWNETDPAARRARLVRDWSTAATYVDPMADVEGGEAVVEGFDVVETDADGRITGVVGFLDRVPA